LPPVAEDWTLRGTVVVACNCDYGCPCNFNALPTHGKCEGGWTWHVEEGRIGETSLEGLNFTVAVNWPGAIHEGNGSAAILVDERADDSQREAIATLVSGDAGGPWGVLAWTWPTIDGPHPVPYSVDVDGVAARVEAGDLLLVESEPIRNPVTGAEVHPGAVLPEGIIFKRGDFGSAKVNRMRHAVGWDRERTYTAVAPFEYAGP
jgi:hypothetical protein